MDKDFIHLKYVSKYDLIIVSAGFIQRRENLRVWLKNIFYPPKIYSVPDEQNHGHASLALLMLGSQFHRTEFEESKLILTCYLQ